MNRLRPLLLILLTAVAATSCSRRVETKDDDVLARVGERAVTVGQFRKAMARRGGYSPEVFNEVVNKKALLEELVRFELMAEKAREKGLFEDPEVRRAMELFAVNRLQMDLLAAASNDLKVSSKDVADYYASRAEDFRVPEMVRVAVLHIAVPPRVTEEKRRELLAKANKIRQEAVALPAGTSTFGYLAAKYSDDQATRYNGGDMGWLKRGSEGGRWGSDVVKVAFALKQPGELSPLISSDKGFYLLKLIDHRAESVVPLEQVSANLRRQMEERRRRDVVESYVVDLQKSIDVKIDDRLLSAVEPPPAPANKPREVPPAMPAE